MSFKHFKKAFVWINFPEQAKSHQAETLSALKSIRVTCYFNLLMALSRPLQDFEKSKDILEMAKTKIEKETHDTLSN